MNWQHLLTFIWLRWRLSSNQWHRAGAFNSVVTMILTVGAVVMAIPLGIASFVLGIYVIPKAAPIYLMYAADGLILGFLFFWGIGLVTELQRTEQLTLSKFLHLPVSLRSAFLINYVSSLVRMSLLIFVPVMFGFCLALIFAKGALLLTALPALAAFLLMVSALTYQFQGWLASMMSNPRRRRTIVVATTAIFILISQAPNLMNMLGPWGFQQQTDRSAKWIEESAELDRAMQAHEIDPLDFPRRQQEAFDKHQLATQQGQRENAESLERLARLVNQVLPLGWLPLGVEAAAEGRIIPAILGTLAMTLIAVASLWRAYRTTLQIYLGQFTARNRRAPPSVTSPASTRKPGALLLETHLPWLSEPVSAIALGGFRALVRSPEAKMMLLSPILLGGIFGSMLVQRRHNVPELFRPSLAIGGMGFVLFGLLQLMANQFGFDRDGFRVFVLCAASRRDILFGKNLAFAPLAAGMAAIIMIIVQVICPQRLGHFLAMFPQFVSMYLLFCIMANLLSIYAPVHIAAGSLKPSSPKLLTVLLQMVMFLFLFPLMQAPTLLPLTIEVFLHYKGWLADFPICLVLTLAECAMVVLIYRFSLRWQGSLLQRREQRILECVTNRAA